MKSNTAMSVLLALGLLAFAPAFADVDDTMTDIDDDTTPEDVVERLELPESASDTAVAASAFGLETANQAREDGRAFGQAQAERARERGREMGAERAEAASERASAAREQARPGGRPGNRPQPD